MVAKEDYRMSRLLLGSVLFCLPLFGGEALREAAGKRLLVGCAVATRDLDDPKLTALIESQFGCLTPEYDFMPEHVLDDAGNFTFAAGDRVVSFAKAHRMPVCRMRCRNSWQNATAKSWRRSCAIRP